MVCLHAVVLFLCNSGFTLSAIIVGERQMLPAGFELLIEEDVMVLLVAVLIFGGVVD
jgi:hypothetical protein